jgi:hypothetical protein
MIKRVVILMLGGFLYLGAAELEESMSPMELLIFKIGFTGLVEEFEREKNSTAQNSRRIAVLEKNMELLVKFMEMTRGELLKDADTQTPGAKQYGIYDTEAMKRELSLILERYKEKMALSGAAEIAALKQEVAALKRDIRLLASAKNSAVASAIPAAPLPKKKRAIREFRVVVDEMTIRSRPSADSSGLGTLRRDERVIFEVCDRFGWCRLQGREGFVPDYLFLPAD